METKINLVLAGILAATWASMSLAEPAAAMDPRQAQTYELAELEDAFAAQRDDLGLARELADTYLELSQPQLAVATLSQADPSLREDPAILHRLALAYERTGRMQDALDTAELARARCGRVLGTLDSSDATPVPDYSCNERTYAALDMHVGALVHLVREGVTEPSDAQVARAYRRAVRAGRLLSAEAD